MAFNFYWVPHAVWQFTGIFSFLLFPTTTIPFFKLLKVPLPPTSRSTVSQPRNFLLPEFSPTPAQVRCSWDLFFFQLSYPTPTHLTSSSNSSPLPLNILWSHSLKQTNRKKKSTYTFPCNPYLSGIIPLFYSPHTQTSLKCCVYILLLSYRTCSPIHIFSPVQEKGFLQGTDSHLIAKSGLQLTTTWPLRSICFVKHFLRLASFTPHSPAIPVLPVCLFTHSQSPWPIRLPLFIR